MKKQHKHIEYRFQTADGPLLSEQELDELARMIAIWIYRDLRYKKKIPTVEASSSSEAMEELDL